MPADFNVTDAHVDGVFECDDPALFRRANFELGNGLRFDLQLREFLILGQHDLDGSSGDFRKMRDQRIESLGGQAGGAKRGTVPFVDEPDLRGIHAERVRENRAHGVDALAHAPKCEAIAIPLCDAAARLHGYRHAAREVIGELLDHVGLGESLVDIAALLGPGGLRKFGGRIRVAQKIAFSSAQVGRRGRHGVFEG